jgi:hypothetical protein
LSYSFHDLCHHLDRSIGYVSHAAALGVIVSIAVLGLSCLRGTLAGMEDLTPTADAPKPLRSRRTRIGVSILFGVLTVALCVLWVRSYWRKDGAVWVFAPGRYIDVESDRGNLTSRFQDLRGQARFPYDGLMKLTFRSRWLSTSDRFKGFGWHVSRDFVLIASPYWFPVLILVIPLSFKLFKPQK